MSAVIKLNDLLNIILLLLTKLPVIRAVIGGFSGRFYMMDIHRIPYRYTLGRERHTAGRTIQTGVRKAVVRFLLPEALTP